MLKGAVKRNEEFSRGAVVFYWRQDGVLRGKRFSGASRWQGPARIVGRDVNGYWLAHRGFPVLVSKDQLRHASRREIQAWRWVHGEDSLVEGGNQRAYEDLRGPGPSEDDYPTPDNDEEELFGDDDDDDNDDGVASTPTVSQGGTMSGAPAEAAAAPLVPEAPPAVVSSSEGASSSSSSGQQEATASTPAEQVPVDAGGGSDAELDEEEPERSPDLLPAGVPAAAEVVPPPELPPPQDDGAESAASSAGEAPAASPPSYGPLSRALRSRGGRVTQVGAPYLATGTASSSGAGRSKRAQLREAPWTVTAKDEALLESALSLFFQDGRIGVGEDIYYFQTARNDSRKEIPRSRISEKDWPAFERAFREEWLQWLRLGAGTITPPHEACLVPPDQIVGSRPVFTDKNSPFRTLENPLPPKPKCRIVVRGDQERLKEMLR